jgi:hypothetical protein
MRISRHGTTRNHGLSTLARSESSGVAVRSLYPVWNSETRRVEISLRGERSGTTVHTYRIEVSVNELAEMVESATGEADDRATRAFGLAMATFLREAFRETKRGR